MSAPASATCAEARRYRLFFEGGGGSAWVEFPARPEPASGREHDRDRDRFVATLAPTVLIPAAGHARIVRPDGSEAAPLPYELSAPDDPGRAGWVQMNPARSVEVVQLRLRKGPDGDGPPAQLSLCRAVIQVAANPQRSERAAALAL